MEKETKLTEEQEKELCAMGDVVFGIVQRSGDENLKQLARDLGFPFTWRPS